MPAVTMTCRSAVRAKPTRESHAHSSSMDRCTAALMAMNSARLFQPPISLRLPSGPEETLYSASRPVSSAASTALRSRRCFCAKRESTKSTSFIRLVTPPRLPSESL